MQRAKDENNYKEITLESDPCIEKTRFVIRPINFFEFEQAEEIAGNMTAKALYLARKISDHLEKEEHLKEGEKAPPLVIKSSETDALQEMTGWVKKKRTAIVLYGLVGADGARFETQEDVKAYLMSLRPLEAVRKVIDELAQEILSLSGGDEKKSAS